MEEKPDRFDTYDGKEPPNGHETQNQSFKSYQGDLFEVCAEFDLHSVMATTEASVRPARPVEVIRKYK